MSLIDWSDPHEMFGLLVEFVADEHMEAEDPTRRYPPSFPAMW